MMMDETAIILILLWLFSISVFIVAGFTISSWIEFIAEKLEFISKKMEETSLSAESIDFFLRTQGEYYDD